MTAAAQPTLANTFSESYAEIYDLLHAEKPYAEETDFVLALLKQKNQHALGSVLDLACGTGGHVIEFLKRGLYVHGNDLSAEMIAQAQRRLAEFDSDKFSLTTQPMQTVSAKSATDLAVALYTAIGYLVSPDQLDQFFRNLHRLLRPGGLVFADVWNGQKMAQHFSTCREKLAENERWQVRRASLVSHVPLRNALSVQFHFDVLDKRQVTRSSFEEAHEVRYFTVAEIETLLLAHGFRPLHFAPFGETSSIEDCWNFCFLAERRV